MSQDADARFRLMFERSADAILLLDTSTNKFIEYNQAAVDMLRCTREELSALHPSELSPGFQPDGRDSFAAANERIATAIANGSNRFEWIHRSPHRGDFPVEVLLTPIQSGAHPLLLVVWRDITERKRNEEALRQAQKFESLGVIAGGMAHDFNNLLTAMGNHLRLAREQLGEDHPAAAHLVQGGVAVEAAADLCRQMLAYSGHATLETEPLDLKAVVGDMVELLRAAAQGRVRLELAVDGDPAVVELNRTELQQVVLNVVTNAAEASPADGLVTVRCGLISLEGEALAQDLAGQGLRPGDYALLEVEDRGCGMSAEVQARIFDPFFSTKGPGRGLGLSALLGVVRSRGGGVRIHSRPGHGTRFGIALPRSQKPAAQPKAQPSLGAPKGRGTVLVVDDNPAVRFSTRALLEAIGFNVLAVEDGTSAIELFGLRRATIDWVLMDLTMPGLDGHETFLRLRAIDPAVKVVLSSGWAESELRSRYQQDPPLAFLAKPYRGDELERVLLEHGLVASPSHATGVLPR